MNWGAIKIKAAQFIAKALGGPAYLWHTIAAATCSVGEQLAKMWHDGLAADIRQVKDEHIRKMKVSGDHAEAKAQLEQAKVLTEVAEAENKRTLARRNTLIGAAEARKMRADAAKTEAEAKKIVIEAETERQKTIAEARAKLIEAVTKLQAKGGQLYIDPENLKEIEEFGKRLPTSEEEKPAAKKRRKKNT